MRPEQFELLDEPEAELVLRWRFHKLCERGHETLTALLLAARVDVEIELADDLVGLAASAGSETETTSAAA
jgi:hypothetical protein